jgi:aspartate carbamoyltransferase catalytic subunit
MLTTATSSSVVALFASGDKRVTLIAAFGDAEFLEVLGGGDVANGRAVATNMLTTTTSDSVVALFALETPLIGAFGDAELLAVLRSGDVASGRVVPTNMLTTTKKATRSPPSLPQKTSALR